MALASAAFLTGIITPGLDSETLTMTTSYPAPSGVYQSLVTTGGDASAPVNTILARDTGNVLIGGNNAAVQVGIGTASPASALSVAGSVQPGDDALACSAAKAGALRFHAEQLQVCSSNAWTNLAQNTPTVYAPTLFVKCFIDRYLGLTCNGIKTNVTQVGSTGPVTAIVDRNNELRIWAPGQACSWTLMGTQTGGLSPTSVWECL